VTAINVSERAQARAAASAGIETTQARLNYLIEELSNGGGDQLSGDITQNDPWHRADSLFSDSAELSRSAGASYRVIVQDGGCMLNVNTLSEDGWRSLFTAVGIDYDAGDQLAQAIMDWRDPDDDPRTRGAERGQYLRTGLLALPTNKNFASVSELRDVMGMTPQIYALVAPYLSVGVSGRVSVNNADAPVLRTIPGFTDDVVAAILQQRYSGLEYQSLQQLEQQLPASSRNMLTDYASQYTNTLTFTTQEIRVVSTGWAPGGHTQVTAEAVFRPSNVGGRIGMQLVWRRDS
jgi:hypothetical protein